MVTRPSIRSVISQHPLIVAAAGLLTVLTAPFVFFPEIMGDMGVTHASLLRNGAAITVIVLGGIAMIAGLAVSARQMIRQRKKNE